MKISTSMRVFVVAGTIGWLALAGATTPSSAAPALSTEDFLNRLGVNTHLDGTVGWNTDASQVSSQLNYLGVRLDRDWIHSDTIAARWKAVQNKWPMGKFWTSIDETGPAEQRKCLGYVENAYAAYPGLIHAVGGPNEEDDDYAQKLGARLPDSALVQGDLYRWAHSGGLNVPVSQMEFGGGWTAANKWQGDYNPADPGINITHPEWGDQKYHPGPADFASAHTYISNAHQRPVDVLNQIRALAKLSTPGKPVAQTEVGAYKAVGISTHVYGQYMVMGAFDSTVAGDVAYLVYGLQDGVEEGSYGFYTGDGAAHPAADYYHTMTTLLKSEKGTYGSDAPPTFTPGTLSPTYSHADVSHLLLQKPTGEYIIAAWSEQLLNGSEHPVTETITFGKTFASVTVYDIESGTTPIATLTKTDRCTIAMNASDTYLVVLGK